MISIYIMYTLALVGATVTVAYFQAELMDWRHLRRQELRKYRVGSH